MNKGLANIYNYYFKNALKIIEKVTEKENIMHLDCDKDFELADDIKMFVNRIANNINSVSADYLLSDKTFEDDDIPLKNEINKELKLFYDELKAFNDALLDAFKQTKNAKFIKDFENYLHLQYMKEAKAVWESCLACE